MASIGTFPFVLGHETAGRVVEVGADCSVSVGSRVVLDPCIPCLPRGIDPLCANCARGWTSSCLNLDSRIVSSGRSLGFTQDLGGGWAESVLAHESMIHPLPEAIEDRGASLYEPVSIACHGLMRAMPADGEPVLIVGAGIIGLAALAALRGLFPGSAVTVLARHAHQGAAAAACGADHVVLSDPGNGHWEELASLSGSRVVGRKRHQMLMGGFPYVVEAVGSPQSVTESLRAVAHRGTVLLLGAAGISEVDLTPVWYKEAALVGSIDHTVDASSSPGLAGGPGPPFGRPRTRRTVRRPVARLRRRDTRVLHSRTTGRPSRRPSTGTPPTPSRWCSDPRSRTPGPARHRGRGPLPIAPHFEGASTVGPGPAQAPSVRCRCGCPRRRGDRRRPRCCRSDGSSGHLVRCWSIVISLAVATPTLALDPPAGASASAVTSATPGPAAAYRCSFNVNTDAFTGADGTASAIGWLGDHNSVVTCLGGTFLVQDGPGICSRTTASASTTGSAPPGPTPTATCPAQVTTFDDRRRRRLHHRVRRHGWSSVGNPFVAVYSRVRVANPTGHTVTADPEASPSLIPLDSGSRRGGRHTTPSTTTTSCVSDRFGSASPWPNAQALAAAGGFDQHFAHMRAFWNAQLAAIARISVPDAALVDAYKSGFISTQIARSGDALDTGVNGYESEFSHDVIGILTNLFTQGYFTDAHALLTEARERRGVPGPVRGRSLDLRGAVGRLPVEDGRHGPSSPRTSPRRVPPEPPNRASRMPPTRSPPTARDRWGRWRPRTTSTPRDTGPPTTTRRCSGWPPTATSPPPSATRPRRPGPTAEYRQPPRRHQLRARADDQP